MCLKTLQLTALGAALAFLPAAYTLALTDQPQAFRDAYYLETHEGDLAGAIAAYEKVLASGDAPAEIQAEARARLAACREDLRSADLAALMPPEAIAYLEVRQPGTQLEKLLQLLGLTAPAADFGPPAKTGDDEGFTFPGQPALIIPRKIVISSALIREAKAFRGAAVALTDMDFDRGQPQGVAIVHPGDVDLLRGLIETGVQFIRPAGPIREFRTIEVRDAGCAATIVFTHRLVIAGTHRELVADVVERLLSDQPSLARTNAFLNQSAPRADAVLYAFVNTQELLRRLQQVASHDGDARQRLAVGQALFDLARLNAASLAIGASDEGIAAEFVMAMADGQMNLVYNLLRTPPMCGDALQRVPAGAAAVLAVGINPGHPTDEAARSAAQAQTVQAITGLDLGRELFSNIREMAVFVLPPADGAPAQPRPHPIPDACLVTVVGDPAKSEALWDFLLALPGRFSGNPELKPEVSTTSDVEVRAYPLPSGLKFHFVRNGSSMLIGTTAEAIAAALAAQSTGQNVLTDSALASATGRIGENTSIAVIAHAGRLAKLAAQRARGDEAHALALALVSQAAADTTATMTVDEAPTRLRIRARIDRLPNVQQFLDALAQAGVLRPASVQLTQVQPGTPEAADAE